MLNKKINNITSFLLNGILFFICWSILYKFILVPYTNLDSNLSAALVNCSENFLSAVGYSAHAQTTEGMVIIAINGTDGNGVWVGDNCNGLSLFVLFTFYCLSFPNSKNLEVKRLIKNWLPIITFLTTTLIFYNYNEISNVLLILTLLLSLVYFIWHETSIKKIFFILFGLILIHIVNVLRTSILTIMEKDYREYLDFNHNYTFQIIVYGLVFYLWYLWTSKFILSNEKKPKK